jgi:hypothetical protein
LIDIDEAMERIPQSSLEKVSYELVKILLGSTNTDKMPERLAKAILYYWQNDQLSAPTGIRALLEASATLEEDGTKALLQCL